MARARARAARRGEAQARTRYSALADSSSCCHSAPNRRESSANRVPDPLSSSRDGQRSRLNTKYPERKRRGGAAAGGVIGDFRQHPCSAWAHADNMTTGASTESHRASGAAAARAETGTHGHLRRPHDPVPAYAPEMAGTATVRRLRGLGRSMSSHASGETGGGEAARRGWRGAISGAAAVGRAGKNCTGRPESARKLRGKPVAREWEGS